MIFILIIDSENAYDNKNLEDCFGGLLKDG